MKNQYMRLFSFLFGLTFIISGVIFTYTKIYKDNKSKNIEKESEIVDEIGSIYEKFYDKANEVNEFRNGVIDDIGELVSYYNNMEEGYTNVVSDIKTYETQIVELEDISFYLTKHCGTKYSELDANRKCDAFYINLEKTINLFIGDISFFNTKVDEYNEWIEEENKSEFLTDKYKPVDKYDILRYKEYVDLNGDGTYLGNNTN